MKETKQVYFAVVVEVEVAEDGTEKIIGSWIDDERAVATWNKQDVWLEPQQEWVDIYEENTAYEMAQEALQNAVAVMNKEDN